MFYSFHSITSVISLLLLCTLHTTYSAPYSLTVLHTNNIRGRVLPFIESSQTECTIQQIDSADCVGGLARRVTYVKQQRLRSENSILVDSGQQFFGTLFYSIDGGTFLANSMNQLQYDCIGLGTNEFFENSLVLKRWTDNIDAIAINSNIDFSGDSVLSSLKNGQQRIRPYYVKIVNGRQIGFVSIAPDYLAEVSHPDKLLKMNTIGGTVRTTIQMIQIAVAGLKSNYPSCNIIVLLCNDDAIVEEIATTVEHIDIILISQSAPIWSAASTNPSTKYPHVYTSYYGKTVLAGQNGDLGLRVGNLNVTFNDDGEIMQYSGDSVVLTNTTASDPTTVTQIKAQLSLIDSYANVVVGKIPTSLYGERGTDDSSGGCRWGDCNIARVMNDALLWYCEDCEIAFFNAGSIRASIAYNSAVNGNITRRAVVTAFPFTNTMAITTLTGLTINQVAMRSYAKEQRGTGPFLQWAGLRLAYNPTLTQPVLEVQVFNKKTGKWELIDPLKTYRVATNDYLKDGKDGYTMIAANQINTLAFLPQINEILIDYIQKNTPISVEPTSTVMKCSNNSLLLNQTAGLTDWPNNCRMLRSAGFIDTYAQCDSDYNQCSVAIAEGREAFPGKQYNSSFCNKCTGLGTCSLKKCICDPPLEYGEFAGMKMIQGDQCSEIREELKMGNGLQAFLIFLCVLNLAFTVISSIFYTIHRAHFIVRRSSPLFLQLVNVGSLLGAICGLQIILTTTAQTCSASWYLGHFTFVLVFGSLLVKTYRIYRIFLNKRTKVLVLTDWHMLGYLCVFVAAEIALLIAHEAVSQFHSTPKEMSSSFQFYRYCTSPQDNTFLLVGIGYKCLLVLWCVFLTFSIKDIDQKFNESKLLATILYHMTIIAVIVIALSLMLSSSSPIASTAIVVIGLQYTLIFTNAALCIPKMFQLKQLQNGNNVGLTHNITQDDQSMLEDETNATNKPRRASVQFQPINSPNSAFAHVSKQHLNEVIDELTRLTTLQEQCVQRYPNDKDMLDIRVTTKKMCSVINSLKNGLQPDGKRNSGILSPSNGVTSQSNRSNQPLFSPGGSSLASSPVIGIRQLNDVALSSMSVRQPAPTVNNGSNDSGEPHDSNYSNASNISNASAGQRHIIPTSPAQQNQTLYINGTTPQRDSITTNNDRIINATPSLILPGSPDHQETRRL